MAELTVEVRSHHFVVRSVSARARPVVEKFAHPLREFGFVKQRHPPYRLERVPVRVFAAATSDRSEYRFHINSLKGFLEHIQFSGIGSDDYVLLNKPLKEAEKVEFKIKPNWHDQPHQIEVIQYMGEPGARSKFVDLQTGKGKGYCTMRALSEAGVRTIVSVLPRYMTKWHEELMEIFDFEMKDVMLVSGSKQIKALLELAAMGALDAKVLVVSNKTLGLWIKAYEQFGDNLMDEGYICPPDELYEVTGSGRRVIDEVHQDFHLNFKQDLYTHVDGSIALSATMVADNDFMNRMYELMFPTSQRYKGQPYHKYIASHAVMYHFHDPSKIRTHLPGRNDYSHVAFEQTLMKQGRALDNYVRLIKKILDMGAYTQFYQTGDKAAIFCSTVEMCTYVVNFFKEAYPDKDVRRYCANQGDSFDNTQEADIVVSTLLSAGTAVDMPRLTAVIMTIALSTSQGNIQGFGRLRELDKHLPAEQRRTPHFYYFVCEDFPKHLQYHDKKKEILHAKAKTYRSDYVPDPI